MTEPLNLFTIYHLNLAYSSIEKEQHKVVLEQCYWPLLELAKRRGLPFGIEASVFTLEAAAAADPAWLDELRTLVTDGPCEFVGAGLSQLIGPVAPASVVDANLRIGNEEYQRLLGVTPQIGLVNEQAYSAGLVEHYVANGYDAIFMEWDNPARAHPEWDSEYRYLPQIASGQDGEEIEVIWNLSTAFQKFQRYVHGEMALDEYVAYLGKHAAEQPRVFPLYGNDIEIFDFRPGRYKTEAVVEHKEWQRIDDLFAAIETDDRFEFIAPSEVLGFAETPQGGMPLSLESSELPVPVKKQGKYNVSRWAITGRDDLGINTRCRRIAAALEREDACDDWWYELCYLWSSDFRTHITQKRWDEYIERLTAFEAELGIEPLASSPVVQPDSGDVPGVTIEGRNVDLETDSAAARLNSRRGLAVESLTFADCGDQPLVGTLEHGYFDDINMTADYYTGHLVLERPGQHKVSDLGPVEPVAGRSGGRLSVAGTVQTPLGAVGKTVRLHESEPRLDIEYAIDWPADIVGSLRLAHMTLLPEAFDVDSLYYATHNGGERPERFSLAGTNVDHGAPVSLLVTASSAVGMTGGWIEFGDADKAVRLAVEDESAALVGLVTYRAVGDTFFCRVALSAIEVDETRKPDQGAAKLPSPIRLSITAINH